MREVIFQSHAAQDTMRLASLLAPFLRTGDVLGFHGNLGSGKTTFIQGLARKLGFRGPVNSPSFVVLKIYPLSRQRAKKAPGLFHFDLYRLNSSEELCDTGFFDFLDAGISVIEWADKAGALLPKECLKIFIHFKKERDRIIRIRGYGSHYEALVNKLQKKLHSRGE